MTLSIMNPGAGDDRAGDGPAILLVSPDLLSTSRIAGLGLAELASETGHAQPSLIWAKRPICAAMPRPPSASAKCVISVTAPIACDAASSRRAAGSCAGVMPSRFIPVLSLR